MRAAFLAVRSNLFQLVAAGVSRLKSPSSRAAKSETTHVGCYFLIGLAALVAVVTLPFVPAAAAAELTGREIQAAQKLYVAKCARCHKFYDPESYSAAEWDMWMAKMGKKARLKPDQFNVLSAYLATVRSGKAP